MICALHLNFYVFLLGMTFADVRTHLLRILSASFPIVSMISRPTMHASLTGTDFGQGRRRGMLLNPKNRKGEFSSKFMLIFNLILTLIKILLCSDLDFVF